MVRILHPPPLLLIAILPILLSTCLLLDYSPPGITLQHSITGTNPPPPSLPSGITLEHSVVGLSLGTAYQFRVLSIFVRILRIPHPHSHPPHRPLTHPQSSSNSFMRLVTPPFQASRWSTRWGGSVRARPTSSGSLIHLRPHLPPSSSQSSSSLLLLLLLPWIVRLITTTPPPHAGITLEHSVVGLSPGTAYQFRVRAVNHVGPGMWSVMTPEIITDVGRESTATILFHKNRRMRTSPSPYGLVVHISVYNR
jgi:hypothetical protein